MSTEEVLQRILSEECWWEDGEDYTCWTVVSGGPADTLRALLASVPVVSLVWDLWRMRTSSVREVSV